MRLVKWAVARRFASLTNIKVPPEAPEAPDVVRYAPKPQLQVSPDDFSPHQRSLELVKISEQLAAGLSVGNVHSLLRELPPLMLQALVETQEVRRLQPIQLLSFLNFLTRFGYTKTVETTPTYDYLAEIVEKDLGSFSPEEVVLLGTVLVKLGITREEMFRPISLLVMETASRYSPRALANLMTHFIAVANSTKSFTGFYEFMKVPLTEMMLADRLDARDLLGVSRAYSKTFNMTPAFMAALEESVVKINSRRPMDPKALTVTSHSLNLNRSLHNAVRVWDILDQAMKTRADQFNFSELLLALKTLRDNGKLAPPHFHVLVERVNSQPPETNLFDVRDAFDLYFHFAEAHPTKFFDEKEMKRGRKVLRARRRPVFENLLGLFQKLSRNVEAPDVLFHLRYVNFAVQMDSRGGRAYVLGLKEGLKRTMKEGGLRDSEANLARQLIEGIEDQWIRNSFLGKLA